MDSAASTLRPKAAPFQPLLFWPSPYQSLTTYPSPTALPPQQAALVGVGVHMGLWPSITGGKSTAFMAGGQEQCLDFFGDTVSHLPDCCSFIRIGVGCGRALSTAPPHRKPLSVSDICPAKLVTWHPALPNGSNPLHGPGANSNPTRVRPGANPSVPK